MALCFILGAAVASERAADPVRYQLLEGSTFVDDCLICERPTILHPLRGAFDLALADTTPIASRYAVQNLAFIAGADSNQLYSVSGRGEYRVSGEVAVFQDMQLEATVNDRGTVFTNSSRTLTRAWPMIEIDLVQTNGTLTQQFSMHLVAAPLREIWFSVNSQFNTERMDRVRQW